MDINGQKRDEEYNSNISGYQHRVNRSRSEATEASQELKVLDKVMSNNEYSQEFKGVLETNTRKQVTLEQKISKIPG